MAQVFNKSLPVAPVVQPSAYDLLMTELAKDNPPAKPMFSQEQQAQRIRQNNDLTNLGLLGQMSGDENTQSVGGQVFKQAIGNRQEHVDPRGTFDPLTGVLAESPDYQNEKKEKKKAKIFEQALKYEDRNLRAQEREDRDSETRSHREDMIRLTASLRPNNSIPKPPPGYRYTADGQGQEPIPGGPADRKLVAADTKAQTANERALEKSKLVVGTIDTALNQIGPFTTGLMGSQLAKVKGSPAYNLRKTVETVKANIGFDELSAMRQASPTGGALGQVAVQELNFLQATLGNLDADQDQKQMATNLKKVREHYAKWQHVMEMHATSNHRSTPVIPGGGGSSSPMGPPSPSLGAVSPSAAPVAPGPGAAPRTRTLPNGVVIEYIN